MDDDFFGDMDDDLFDNAIESPLPPRKTMPTSYEKPLAQDGQFLSPDDQQAVVDGSFADFQLVFTGEKLAPSNIQSLMEREYLLANYACVLRVGSHWIAANKSQPKPFNCLEACDMTARAALRQGDCEAALQILQTCADIDFSKPTQTTAGQFLFLAQLLRKCGDSAKALNALIEYSKVRPKDYRAFIEVAEIFNSPIASATHKTVSLLAMRRAQWLLKSSILSVHSATAPAVVSEYSLQGHHNRHEIARMDAFVDNAPHKHLMDEFDASAEDEEVVKARTLCELKDALPDASDSALDWIRDDVLLRLRSSAMNDLVEDEEEDISLARA
ncbi:hypothetical protein HDU98_008559 [Podochytrium sp. JEL0797]|nr:hypothetical protein HDU98_008559 [Podochytrium sp. JEL0797]